MSRLLRGGRPGGRRALHGRAAGQRALAGARWQSCWRNACPTAAHRLSPRSSGSTDRVSRGPCSAPPRPGPRARRGHGSVRTRCPAASRRRAPWPPSSPRRTRTPVWEAIRSRTSCEAPRRRRPRSRARGSPAGAGRPPRRRLRPRPTRRSTARTSAADAPASRPAAARTSSPIRRGPRNRSSRTSKTGASGASAARSRSSTCGGVPLGGALLEQPEARHVPQAAEAAERPRLAREIRRARRVGRVGLRPLAHRR